MSNQMNNPMSNQMNNPVNNPMSNQMNPKMMQQMYSMMQQYNPMLMSDGFAFNPSKLDKGLRKQIVNTTISKTKIGPYSKVPFYKPHIYSLVPDYKPSEIDNICKVSIVHKHSLDAVEPYAEKGIDIQSNTTGYNPVIINVIGSDFSGNIESSDDIRDELIIFRTTFNNTSTSTSGSIFPLHENQAAYAKIVYNIRTNGPSLVFLPYKDMYRFSLITTSPLKIKKLLGNGEMHSDNYIKTLNIIECIFQVAIAGGNNVLILTPFGDNEIDNNPIVDIIKIYNFCIFKYGHKFNEIIIAVPEYYSNETFEEYAEKIVNPMDLVAEIDLKYDQLKMKKKLEKTSKRKNEIDEDDEKPNHQIPPQQMELMMKMMQNPMFMQMMKRA